jgi:hypothetical protein
MIRALLLATALASLSFCMHPAGAQQVSGGPTTFTRLYATGASVGNGADLTEDTLQTVSLPTGTFGTIGDTVHIVASGTLAASTDSKTVRVKFGSNQMGPPVASAATNLRWTFDAVLVRTGASQFSFTYWGAMTGGTGTTTINGGTTSQTETSPIVVAVTGQNVTTSAAGSITCQLLTVDFVRGLGF